MEMVLELDSEMGEEEAVEEVGAGAAEDGKEEWEEWAE